MQFNDTLDLGAHRCGFLFLDDIQLHMHMLQRPFLAPGIHRQGDGGARSQRREQQLVRIGAGVAATEGLVFIRQPLVRTRGQVDGIGDLTQLGVNGRIGHLQ
ncbi:hypothetical protein D3C75_1049570 [compost metagenome]